MKSHNDGDGLYSQPFPCKTKPLLRRRLHIHRSHVQSEQPRYIPPDNLSIRTNFRNLSNDSQIHMSNLYIGLMDMLQNSVQQDSRIGIVECRIGIRKEDSDIPRSDAAEQGIHQRVQQNIPIRMGQHIRRTDNGYSPQPHGPGRLFRLTATGILMDIISIPDTRDTLSCHTQHFQILRCRDLFVPHFSLRNMHSVSAQFEQAGVVSDNPAFLFRMLMGSP